MNVRHIVVAVSAAAILAGQGDDSSPPQGRPKPQKPLSRPPAPGPSEVNFNHGEDSGGVPLKSVEVSTDDGQAALAVGGTGGCASAGGASC